MIKQPVNQIRLTNVVIVRLKRGGKRFELACYPNKVASWRDNIERDLDEVLQISRVFTNVSKGVVAKKADLKKCFGTDKQEQVVKMILEKGEVQVTTKERQQKTEELYRDIATIVADKCVNPNTGTALTVSMVERAMKDIHYSVTKRTAKKQALDVIRLLTAANTIPIARASMRILITLPSKQGEKAKSSLTPLIEKLENESTGRALTMTCLIAPGSYRKIEEIVNSIKKADVEVLELSVLEATEPAPSQTSSTQATAEANATEATFTETNTSTTASEADFTAPSTTDGDATAPEDK